MSIKPLDNLKDAYFMDLEVRLLRRYLQYCNEICH